MLLWRDSHCPESTESYSLSFARDIFLFCYFVAGINFKDIAPLRYGRCTELDFKLPLNREIESFILSFLIKGEKGIIDISDFTPDPNMTKGVNWLQYHPLASRFLASY